MNGFWLVVPFIFIRFVLLSMRSKAAVQRAAYFAPMAGNEMAAYWIYQISNAAIFICLCFITVAVSNTWGFWAGLLLYVSGLILCAVSVVNFASPSPEGINRNGIYRFSRNPMYVAYDLYFAGCAILTQSLILGVAVLIFIISSHWIIRAEERWCMDKFGDEYRQYMKAVRRYI